jgi:hypothetical protein
MPSHQFMAAEQISFEWFFLLVDAGNDRGIWARNGLDPAFVPAAGSSAQLKSLIDSGIKIGFVNAAEPAAFLAPRGTFSGTIFFARAARTRL